MSAYLIVDVDTSDPVQYEDYKRDVPALIHAFAEDPDYQPLKALRHRIANCSLVAVDGL